MRPSFLIIGTQKGGTTSLYEYLIQHPDVSPAIRKEIHFFDMNHGRGQRWYRAYFPLRVSARIHRLLHRRDLVVGEATPYYLYHPRVAELVAEELPDVKCIVLLRNPTDRAISHYHHEVRGGFETLSLEDALTSEDDRLRGEAERLATDPEHYSYVDQHFSYKARGRYVDQLDRWFKAFPREQFLILDSNQLFFNPISTVKQVLDFLGLDSNIMQLTDVQPYNKGNYREISQSARDFLDQYFSAYNSQLFSSIEEHFEW